MSQCSFTGGPNTGGRSLGEKAYPAERSAAMFRQLDEQSIRDLGTFDRGNEYLSRARQFVQALEQQMIEEASKGRQVDPSWDPKALREDARELIGKAEAEHKKNQKDQGQQGRTMPSDGLKLKQTSSTHSELTEP